MRSKLPSVERFEEWVVGELLPKIRKRGGYIVAAPEEPPEVIMARALLVVQATIQRHCPEAGWWATPDQERRFGTVAGTRSSMAKNEHGRTA